MRSTSLAVVLAAVLAACGGEDEPAIVIGGVLADDVFESARLRLRAVELAARHLEEAGVFSVPVRVINLSPSVGENADPQLAASHAVTLHEQHGVVGVVSMSSGVASAIIQRTNEPAHADLVQCSCSATSISINDPAQEGGDRNDTFYRTVVHDAFQGQLLAKLIIEEGFTQVGVYYIDDPYGHGLYRAVDERLAPAGIPLVFEKSFPSGEFSLVDHKSVLDDVIDRSRNGQLQVLVIASIKTQAPDLLAYLTEHGFAGTLLLGDGAKSTEVFGIAQSIPEWAAVPGNRIIGTEPDNLSGVNSEAFVRSFQEAFAEEPESFSPAAYDCAMAIGLALLHAGKSAGLVAADVKARLPLFKQANRGTEEVEIGLGAEEVARAAREIAGGKRIDFQGASGRLLFDERGDRPEQGMATFTLNATGTGWQRLHRYDSALQQID